MNIVAIVLTNMISTKTKSAMFIILLQQQELKTHQCAKSKVLYSINPRARRRIVTADNISMNYRKIK